MQSLLLFDLAKVVPLWWGGRKKQEDSERERERERERVFIQIPPPPADLEGGDERIERLIDVDQPTTRQKERERERERERRSPVV